MSLKLNFRTNTIESTSGIDLNITPLAGQQLVLDGTIIVDAGVITGATSITSTAFVGAMTGNADTATTAAGLSATLVETSGGTGTATFTTGDILYASATNTLSKLTAGTINFVLTSGGAGVAPSWTAAGSGTVTSSGAPLNNEVAVFATATDINSDSTFTWDGTTLAVTGLITSTDNVDTTHSMTVDNDSTGTGASARMHVVSGDASLALFAAGTNKSVALVTGGPTGMQGVLRLLGSGPLVFATANTSRMQIEAGGDVTIANALSVTGGIRVEAGAGDGTLELHGDNSSFIDFSLDGSGATDFGARLRYFTDHLDVQGADLHVDQDLTVTGDITVNASGKLRLLNAGDASLGGDTHAFQVGLTAGGNVIIDNNEIIARNNGAATELFLNTDGGSVTIGNVVNAGLKVRGSITQNPQASSISDIKDVASSSFDVDVQYKIGGTLTALKRWDSSANIFSWMDRDPSPVTQMSLNLETGDLIVTGDVNADNFEATGLGPNTTPGTDDTYIGGYGMLGSRTGTTYVSNVQGAVSLNHTGVHATNTKLATLATGIVVTGDVGATTIAGVAAANIVGKTSTETISGAWTFTGENTTTAAGMTYNDNVKTHYGTGEDFDIYFNGTDGYMDLASGADWRLRHVSENMIVATANSSITLYHNGVDTFRTQAQATDGQTSGAAINDHQDTFRDVGFNDQKEIVMTTNITLNDEHAGSCIRKTGSGTVTLTMQADLTLFPYGSMCTVLNHGTGGSLTISDGSENMYIMDGSGTVVNHTGFVLAVAGVLTIWRQGASAYFVWGAGIP